MSSLRHQCESQASLALLAGGLPENWFATQEVIGEQTSLLTENRSAFKNRLLKSVHDAALGQEAI